LLTGGVFEITPIILKQSIIVFKVVGNGAKEAFGKESGGHQWQRVPPSEKKGRVQTSLITIAVLPEINTTKFSIPEKDIRFDTTRGTGPGGQHKNKTETAVRATHIPTGISVFVDSRSQYQNKQDALEILIGRLQEIDENTKNKQRDDFRKNQIGDNERGSKIRIIREKDGIVINNLNNKKISYKDYCRGNLDLLLQ
jgi:peptide chain release factor 1